MWGVPIVFLILSLFFIPHWLLGQVYGSFDLSNITIPVEDIFARYQKQGIIPVWVPEIQAGYPLVANAIQSFFYPPNAILRQFLPGVWVANLSLLLHIWIAGGGMFVLLRYLKFNRNISIIGALLFGGGGYFIGRIILPHLFFPAAWIPLILWSQIRALEHPKIKNSLLFAMLIAIQIFSGHIQVFVYTIIIMSVVTIAYLLRGACFPLHRRWHVLLVPLAVLLLTAVNIIPTEELLPQSKHSGALSGAELLDVSYPPSQILTMVVPRIFGNQHTYVGAKNEPELMIYFGWFGLLAGIIGIFSRKTWVHPAGLSALGLVTLGFLLAGGKYSPFFYWVIDHVSFWAQFGNPGRALILVHVGWVLLVAFGAEHIITASWRIRSVKFFAALVTISALAWWAVVCPHHPFIGEYVGSIIFLCITIAIILVPEHFKKLQPVLIVILTSIELVYVGFGANQVTPIAIWYNAPRIISFLPAREDAPRIFSNGKIRPHVETDFSPLVGPAIQQDISFNQTIVPQQNGWHGGTVGLTWNGHPIGNENVYLRIIDDSGNTIRETTISGLLIKNGEYVTFAFAPINDSMGRRFTVNLSTNLARNIAPHMIIFANIGGFDYNPTGFLSACSGTQCNPVTSLGWNANADLAMQLSYTQAPFMPSRELLLPLVGESVGQEMIRGFLTLQIGRMYRYMFALGERGDFVDTQLISQRGLLDRLSVGAIVSLFDEHRSLEGMPSVSPVAQFPLGEKYELLYKNDQAFPRIALLSSIKNAQTEQQALDILESGVLSSSEVVVENLPHTIILKKDDHAAISTIRDTPQTVSVRVEQSEQQLLVVRDTMYVGWHAFLDAHEVPIYYTDSVFRGVVVPAGKYTVTFEYTPKMFNDSAIVSVVSWLMAISFLVWRFHIERMQGMKLKKSQKGTA